MEKVFVLIPQGGNSRSEFWNCFFSIDGLQEEDDDDKTLETSLLGLNWKNPF
jgi:hypothetical protein